MIEGVGACLCSRESDIEKKKEERKIKKDIERELLSRFTEGVLSPGSSEATPQMLPLRPLWNKLPSPSSSLLPSSSSLLLWALPLLVPSLDSDRAN